MTLLTVIVQSDEILDCTPSLVTSDYSTDIDTGMSCVDDIQSTSTLVAPTASVVVLPSAVEPTVIVAVLHRPTSPPLGFWFSII